MIDQKKKAILLVSFGTSYEDTRRKNLDRIEEKIKRVFPNWKIYSAWSCGRLIRKVQIQQTYHVDTIEEALERMLEDGICECVVQPTFITDGVEMERTEAVLASYETRFASLRMGKPLLSEEKDVKRIAEIFINVYEKEKKDACLLLMGHGTALDANSFYYILNEQFRKMGSPEFMLGTIEEKDSIKRLLECIQALGRKKVILIPFLLTAGRHVEKDMLGPGPDSWKSQLERAGFDVSGVIRGLGEYEEILELYVSHIRKNMGGCHVFKN